MREVNFKARVDTHAPTLDQINVKKLTKYLSSRKMVAPSCLQAWKQRIGQLPNTIGERYNLRLLTPRDWASHFKNVLHRALLVRGPTEGGPCRCCKAEYENLKHFTVCSKAGELFCGQLLRLACKDVSLTTTRERERFGLFGLTPSGGQIEEGWINIHLLLWKHFIGLLVRIETENDTNEMVYGLRTSWSANTRTAKCHTLLRNQTPRARQTPHKRKSSSSTKSAQTCRLDRIAAGPQKSRRLLENPAPRVPTTNQLARDHWRSCLQHSFARCFARSPRP